MKNTRNLKINKYEFGVDQLGGYTGLASLGGGVISSITGNSEIGNILGGAGSGAMAGASFGVPGMIAGGALGALGGIFGNHAASEQEKKIRRIQKMQEDQRDYSKLSAFNNQQVLDYYSKNNKNIQTFKNGGVIGNEIAYVDDNESIRTPDGRMHTVNGFNPNKTDDVLASLPLGSGILSDKLIVPGTKNTFADMGNKLKQNMEKGSKNTGNIANTTNKLNKWAANLKYNEYLSLQNEISPKSNTKGYALGTPLQQVINPLTTGLLNAKSSVNINNVIPNTYSYPTNTNDQQSSGFNFNSTLKGLENGVYGLASLSPVLYNLSRGNKTPDYVAPNNNPYAGSILDTMSRRNIDLQPMYDMNRRATNIANYNANNITSTGQNMAFRLANAAASRTANTDVAMKAQQLNNDYLGQRADMMNNIGQQYVREQNYSDDLNRRNQERTKEFTATALSQLNEWGQTKQLSNNRKLSDSQKYEIWKQLAKYGISQADLSNIDKILK